MIALRTPTRTKISWILAAVLACCAVAGFIQSRIERGKRETVEEELRRRHGEIALFCRFSRTAELDALWQWTSERHRNGTPPGSDSLGRLQPSQVFTEILCGSDAGYQRQLAYVRFLIYHAQYGQAAVRLYHLRKDEPSTWDALDTTMPPDNDAELEVMLALAGKVPHFHLSAWRRWHPHEGADARARAFTLLEGADRSWKVAVANRPDLFTGAEDPATAERVVAALASIGLRVSRPAPKTPLIVWAWSALYDDLERLGREAEALNPDDDEGEPVASLDRHPYDYRRFSTLLAAIRPAPPPRANAPVAE